MTEENYSVTEQELDDLGGEKLDGSGFEDEMPDEETPDED
jgi:hypothetical protein